MLNRVQYRHDSVVINKDGKPVAALVDARFADVPEANGLAEIEAAVALERTSVRSSTNKR
jgi:hypothetical protein